MKNKQQFVTNSNVMEAFNSLNVDAPVIDTQHLRKCKAYVMVMDNHYLLISYKTLVAFIDKRTRICYDILRYNYGYTPTSAQHIAKFCHDYGAVSCLVYRP